MYGDFGQHLRAGALVDLLQLRMLVNCILSCCSEEFEILQVAATIP